MARDLADTSEFNAVVEASAMCFWKSYSRTWKGSSLICWFCVRHVMILCCSILNYEAWVALKDTKFAVYSVYAIMCDSIFLKIFLDSDSLYIKEEQMHICVSSLYMNTCKILPESTNTWTDTQASWTLDLNATPVQEIRSHNSLSAPSASGEAPCYLFSFCHWTLALLAAYCCSFSRMAEESPLQGVSHTTAVQSLECMWGAYQFCKNKVINTWWVIVLTRKNKY